MRQSSWLAVVLCAAGIVLSPVANADEPNTHDKAAAAFVEGQRLSETGNCDAAVPKFRESIAYESSVGARLALVTCIEGRDAVGAWRLLKEAAVLALINHDDRMTIIEMRAANVQNRLATINFKLPAAAEQPGFELRVDGELVDRFMYRSGYAAAGGRHVVEASSNGRRFNGAITVENGAQGQVDIVLQGDDCKTPIAAVAPPAPMVVDRGATRRTLGLAMGGVAVAGLASGAIFGLLTLDKRSSLESQCGGNLLACSAPNQSLSSERDTAKTTATISTVSFIVGGAALLGGLVLYLTAPTAIAPRTGLRGLGGTF